MFVKKTETSRLGLQLADQTKDRCLLQSSGHSFNIGGECRKYNSHIIFLSHTEQRGNVYARFTRVEKAPLALDYALQIPQQDPHEPFHAVECTSA
jgi:hypothetical protein